MFFADRDLGAHVFRDTLHAAGINIERLADHFHGETLDSEWIPKVAAQDWFMLTHDKAITRTAKETEDTMIAGAGLIVLIGKNPILKSTPGLHAEMALNFVHSIHKVNQFLDKHARPFIAKLTRPTVDRFSLGRAGNLEMHLTEADWLATRT